jgi:hypothetical protein
MANARRFILVNFDRLYLASINVKAIEVRQSERTHFKIHVHQCSTPFHSCTHCEINSLDDNPFLVLMKLKKSSEHCCTTSCSSNLNGTHCIITTTCIAVNRSSVRNKRNLQLITITITITTLSAPSVPVQNLQTAGAIIQICCIVPRGSISITNYSSGN